MKLRIETVAENPANIFRRAGYQFQRSEGGEMSFIRPFSASGYPRLHVYCHMEGKALVMNLHLDQKKHTYGNDARHHGEYDNSQVIAEESKRLLNFFQNKNSSQNSADDILF